MSKQDSEIAALVLHWEGLLQEVEAAIHYNQNKGGMQAGTPHFACCPPSVLSELRRNCRAALNKDNIEYTRNAILTESDKWQHDYWKVMDEKRQMINAWRKFSDVMYSSSTKSLLETQEAEAILDSFLK